MRTIFEVEVFGGGHETQHQALAHVQRALQICANSARAPGGSVDEGDILGDGATVIGHWKFSWPEEKK
jgi:hypothetical protein